MPSRSQVPSDCQASTPYQSETILYVANGIWGCVSYNKAVTFRVIVQATPKVLMTAKAVLLSLFKHLSHMAAAATMSPDISNPSKFDGGNELLKHALHNNIHTNNPGSDTVLSSTMVGEVDERPPLTKINSSPATTTPVSNPTTHSKRRRRLTFRPRMTPLDLANPESTNDQFRGFFTLFWLAMGFYVLQTVMRCYEQEGILLSLVFFRLFSKDGLALMVSDLTMVSMTLFSVPFSKLLLWGWLPYNHIGFYLQHIFQGFFLFINIYWTFWR
jgi:hypothetical protein